MTTNDLIDEGFEKCWRQELQKACGNLDHTNYEAFKAGWNACIDHGDIIKSLAECVVFALNHGKWGDSFVMHPETHKSTTPIYFFASALAKYGVKYDRMDLEALHWPAAKRRKYFNDKKKQHQTEG